MPQWFLTVYRANWINKPDLPSRYSQIFQADQISISFIWTAEKVMNLIWTVVVVLIVLWLLGFSIQIGGSLIHLLLVLALIGIVYNLFVGRRGI